jgi:hypothetical protein
MKRTPEYIEGPESLARLTAAMKHILSVPSAEIQRREAEYQKQSAANPNRRGPKRKPKPAGHAPAVEPPS